MSDELRTLRVGAGYTGKTLALRCGWHASKISRIEKAKQMAEDSDIAAILAACEVPSDQAADYPSRWRALRVEVREWQEQLRQGGLADMQRNIIVAEGMASTIRGFVTALVPGLLQVPDYARAVFEVAHDFHGVTTSVDEAVRLRMEQQQILYSGKPIEFVFDEACLWHPIAPPAVMRAQAARLIASIGIPNLKIGILALGRPLPLLTMNSYNLEDTADGGRVVVETVSSELVVTDSAEVQLYRKHFALAGELAVTGDEARNVLAKVEAHYREAEDHE
jgi:transcriptional regulator with XRE-family HTH domain